MARTSIGSRPRAFTLLEVVIAIGVFALGMVAVIGLFAPVAKSVGHSAEAETAVHLAEAIKVELTQRVRQAGSFEPVSALLKSADGSGGHELTNADNNPNAAGSDLRSDAKLLFASRDGAKIGGYNDPVWGGTDLDKFFEIALVRNEALSPAENDATAIVLAYAARVRFPAFVPDATPTNPRRALPNGFDPTGPVRFDHSRKQVVFFAGSITR